MSIQHQNRLFAALAPADFRLIKPHLQTVDLPVPKILEVANKAIATVYFPETGFASIVSIGRGKREIEVGVIGREGMTGLAVVTGADRSPHQTYIQVAGAGLCMPAEALRTAMRRSRTLHASLLKFVQAFLVQSAQTAAANGLATIAERLARWLLMAHDRLEGDDIPLTHEFLAIMLGVRRAGVTQTLDVFRKRRLIRVTRGRISVLNRKGIEAMAGVSYGVPEAELRRLVG